MRTFKTFEEYKAFYAASSEDPPRGGKWYQIGVEIAKAACEQAEKASKAEMIKDIMAFAEKAVSGSPRSPRPLTVVELLEERQRRLRSRCEVGAGQEKEMKIFRARKARRPMLGGRASQDPRGDRYDACVGFDRDDIMYIEQAGPDMTRIVLGGGGEMTIPESLDNIQRWATGGE